MAGPGRGGEIRPPLAEERDLKAELREAELRLAEARAEIDRLRERLSAELADRDELIAVVSHELQTPLTVIAGFNGLLMSERVGKLNAEQRRFLTESERSCRRLQAFVGNLIEASRQSAGEGPLELREASLEAAVRGVVEFLHPLFEERGLRAELALAPDAARARFHPLRMEQVLVNLIGNAIRHTPANGEIAVALRAVAGGVEVLVHDDGPGIPAEVRDALRNPPLFGARRATIGLGLQIVRRILELHGSRLDIDDSVRGTRVRFELPAANPR
jgi:signal transduction histidine kinase